MWHKYRDGVTPDKLETIDHSAYELLLDPEGRSRVIYESHFRPEHLLHDLRVLGLSRDGRRSLILGDG